MNEYEQTAIEIAMKRKKRSGGKSAQKKVRVNRMPIATEISQQDAKLYVPEGGHIWRDRLDGAWCSHFPPFRRFSASFRKFGQPESLRLNLLDLWTKWCLVHGVPHADCPMQGIIGSSPVQDGGGAASSSSAGAA